MSNEDNYKVINFGCGNISGKDLDKIKGDIYVDPNLGTYNPTFNYIKNYNTSKNCGLIANDTKFICTIEQYCDMVYFEFIKQGRNIRYYKISDIITERVIEHIPFEYFLAVILPRLLWLSIITSDKNIEKNIETVYPDYKLIINSLKSNLKYLEFKNIQYEIFGAGEHVTAYTSKYYENILKQTFKRFFYFNAFKYKIKTDPKIIKIDNKPFYRKTVMSLKSNYKFKTINSILSKNIITLFNPYKILLSDILYDIYKACESYEGVISIVFIDSDKINNIFSNDFLLNNDIISNYNFDYYKDDVNKCHQRSFSHGEVYETLLAENYFVVKEMTDLHHPILSTIKVAIKK